MLNKNLIFIFFSLLLGLLISLYYKKNIFLFIPISIILYIFFYYLADIKNNEYFDDYLEEEHKIYEEECPKESVNEPINEPIKEPPSSDIKSQIGYGPLNINISYNSQNSVNELSNTQSTPSSTPPPSNPPLNPPIPKLPKQYNNSFWTNYPNVNIPSYEPTYSYKYKNNLVCPLMINTPWTEYKSGDSEPEPYNM